MSISGRVLRKFLCVCCQISRGSIQQASRGPRRPSFLQNFVRSRPFYSSTVWSLQSLSSAQKTHAQFRTSAAFLNLSEKSVKDSDKERKTGLTEDEEDADKERRRQKLERNTLIGGFMTAVGMVAGGVMFLFYYGAPGEAPDGSQIVDEFSELPFYLSYPQRAWRELKLWYHLVREPSREKLLPDELKPPYYQPKYTLVVEMTGILVHPEWTYSTGWRFKKRPAVEYFLQLVGYPQFEVVIFTQENGFTAAPILESLDPQQLICYKLFRDTTKYMHGHHIKDLSKLNRDLSKVIMVDWNMDAISLQPENALRVPKWEGDNNDTALVDLAGLLRMIQTSNVDDVRPIVQHYSSFEDPLKEFRRRSHEVEQTQSKDQKKEASLTKTFSGRGFGFRGRH